MSAFVALLARMKPDKYVPVTGTRQCVGRSANTKRHNLGGIQPSDAKPSDSEDGVEEEQENCGGNTCTSMAANIGSAGGEDNHAYRLTDGLKSVSLWLRM